MGQGSTGAKGTRRLPPLWLDIFWVLALVAGVVNLAMGARYVLGALAGPISSSPANDFQMFYESAAAWRTGNDLYTTGNLNPPVFVLLFSPLTSVPMPQALVVWWILNFAALGVASALILRELSLRITRWVILLGVLFAGTQGQIILGQVAWLCMLLATLAWRDWRHRKMGRAGLWLGLLIGVKPIFLPVLGLALIRKEHKALGSAIGAVLATLVVGALGCGWTAYPSWIRAGTDVRWQAVAYNASLRGVVARLFEDAVGRPIWIVGAVSILGWAVWRLLRNGPSADRDLSAAFLTSLLISPLGWVYYLPVALGPILATLRSSKVRMWSVVCLAGLFWPPGVGWVAQSTVLHRTTRNAVFGSLYAVGLMTLWWLCLRARGETDMARDADRTAIVPDARVRDVRPS